MITHHSQTPKYLQKLGIIQQQISQAQNTQVDHEMTIIDGLCEAIRAGQSVPDFIALLKKLYQVELTHIHNEQQTELAQSNREPSVTISKSD